MALAGSTGLPSRFGDFLDAHEGVPLRSPHFIGYLVDHALVVAIAKASHDDLVGQNAFSHAAGLILDSSFARLDL